MSFRCSLGLHAWVEIEEKEDEVRKDQGACVEVWDVTFSVQRCERCGKRREKIAERSVPPHGVKRKKKTLVDREWKEGDSS